MVCIYILNIVCLTRSVLSRDGVSEGQFYQVLLFELDAIRKVGDSIFRFIVNHLFRIRRKNQ